MGQKTGIQRAVELFGNSPTKLAAAVGHGVVRQHVEHWLSVGRVPAEKCPEVAVTTGVALEELNDKVNWGLVRGETVAQKTGAPTGRSLESLTRDEIRQLALFGGAPRRKRQPFSAGLLQVFAIPKRLLACHSQALWIGCLRAHCGAFGRLQSGEFADLLIALRQMAKPFGAASAPAEKAQLLNPHGFTVRFRQGEILLRAARLRFSKSKRREYGLLFNRCWRRRVVTAPAAGSSGGCFRSASIFR